jgi:hypothetical protein
MACCELVFTFMVLGWIIQALLLILNYQQLQTLKHRVAGLDTMATWAHRMVKSRLAAEKKYLREEGVAVGSDSDHDGHAAFGGSGDVSPSAEDPPFTLPAGVMLDPPPKSVSPVGGHFSLEDIDEAQNV